ncbi:MAG: helix-turn-helix domain-containing protein [Eubacteriales bacterium]|nr:helix-turn-helix domain-containing protein [Eubacteriales bacterium]
MQADSLTTYESWNLSHPDIPPRSRLYHLEPIGIGTPYAESLTSYISRLADAHSVYTSTLISRELTPAKARPLPKVGRQPAHKFGYAYSSALNGLTDQAKKWINALELATLRNDLRFLTMLTWAEVLPAAGLMRAVRAWCPACFEEWQRTKQPIYEPLLWSLQVVKICQFHHQYLQFKCPYCNQDSIPLLAWRSRPGYCCQCGQWLGIPLNSVVNDEIPKSELEWQIWIVETVGDLLAVAPSLSSTPEKENIVRALLACADKVKGGNKAAFARTLGVSKSTMHLWCNGKAIPQIDAYLRICRRLGLKLSNLLDGTTLIFETAEVNHRLPLTTKKSRSSNRPFPKEQILHSLNMVLSSNESPPPSMREVARRLGYHDKYLRLHFPDLCRCISTRYTGYRNEQSRLRTELLHKEIRQVVLELHAQGVNPTPRNVRVRLSKPNSFLETAAQMAHKNAIQELGLIKAE